jgi:hypothetical protein
MLPFEASLDLQTSAQSDSRFSGDPAPAKKRKITNEIAKPIYASQFVQRMDGDEVQTMNSLSLSLDEIAMPIDASECAKNVQLVSSDEMQNIVNDFEPQFSTKMDNNGMSFRSEADPFPFIASLLDIRFGKDDMKAAMFHVAPYQVTSCYLRLEDGTLPIGCFNGPKDQKIIIV